MIDKSDYKVALESADADVASKSADLEVKKNEAARRAALTTLSTSVEEKQRYAGDYAVAQAAYQTALVSRDKANINLGRTEVRATVNGFVTNLLLRVGDYANTGMANIAIVDGPIHSGSAAISRKPSLAASRSAIPPASTSWASTSRSPAMSRASRAAFPRPMP